jgi:serine/threonine protein phosphatase 1
MPVIVHGHIPVTEPLISNCRINVDTGAYASGCLTAMRLVANEAPRPLCVGAEAG